MTGTTQRLGLALTSAGLMSAALEAHFLHEPGRNEVFVLGFGLGLGAALLAGRREPYPWAAPAALAAAVGVYASALAAIGAHPLAIGVHALLATLAYLAARPAVRPLAVAAIAMWTPALHLLGPTPSTGPLPPVVGLSALGAALVALALLRLRPTSVAPGLLAVAGNAAVADRHLVVSGGGPDDVLAAILVAAAAILAFVTPQRARVAATALGVMLLVAVGGVLIVGKPYHVDSATVPHHAAELLLAGRQPYEAFDLTEALDRFGLEPQLATHLQDGTELRTLSYPALSFLLVTPFVALGLADVRPVYLGVLVLLVALLGVRLRLEGSLVVAAVVGNVVLLRQHVLAGIDPTWILFIAAAFLSPRQRWVSALALGLAVADRQPAWALAPFVLLAAWREQGWREAAVRATIAAACALVIHLPFVVSAPSALVAGVLGPIFQPLQPYGVGLVRIGWSPAYESLMPRGVHAALVALAFPIAAPILWSRWAGWAAAARVAGFIPLWLAWRSLMSYLDAAPLLALPSVPQQEPDGPAARGVDDQRSPSRG